MTLTAASHSPVQGTLAIPKPAAHWGPCGLQVLVRVHTEDLLADAFGGSRDSGRSQLDLAMEHLSRAGEGVLIYLCNQRGPDAALPRSCSPAEAVHLPAAGSTGTPYAGDLRDYGMAGFMLQELGVASIRLLVDDGESFSTLYGHGIRILSEMPLHSDGQISSSSAVSDPEHFANGSDANGSDASLKSWYPSPTGASAVGTART